MHGDENGREILESAVIIDYVIFVMHSKPASSTIPIHVESRKCEARGFQVLERLLIKNIAQLPNLLHRGCSLQNAPMAALSCAAVCPLYASMEGTTITMCSMPQRAQQITTCTVCHIHVTRDCQCH